MAGITKEMHFNAIHPRTPQLTLVPPSHDAYGTLCVLVQRLARRAPLKPEVCFPYTCRGDGHLHTDSDQVLATDADALPRAPSGQDPCRCSPPAPKFRGGG